MKHKIIHLLLAVMFASATTVFPQSRVKELIVNGGCNYDGEPFDSKVYTFESDAAAVAAVDRILDPLGLVRNFDVRAADVRNAAAVIHGETRYLLYNQEFIRRVKAVTRTDWAATSIMAHEIGHHLNGHTLIPGGSRPPTELEADSFSGFVLYKMGATIEQAQAAMNAISSERGSSTHPPRRSRLAAVEAGWTKAQGQDKSSSRTPIKPTVKPDFSSVIGKWRGTWSVTGGSVFCAKMELENLMDADTIQGTITWKLESSSLPTQQSKIGFIGVEFVRGRYDPDTRMLFLEGYRKDDPYEVIGIDKYRLKFSESGISLIGVTWNHGHWDAKFSLSR